MSTNLKSHLASKAPHLSIILNAAQSIIATTTNPLRYSFAALALRELLREFFAVVAPDAAILAAQWHTIVDTKRPVTRRDRILFSVYGFLKPSFFPKPFSNEVDQLVIDLIAKIDDLSKYLHVTPAVMATPTTSLQAEYAQALDLFEKLIQAIESAHAHVLDELATQLTDTLSEMFSAEFFQELDSLSTHTRPQWADDVAVTITSIDSRVIEFSGNGTVAVDLQYGSDGDCRRGDGLECSDSYPFSFKGHSAVSDPLKVEVGKDDVSIDTSSFYE
jgi:hypothetical protein